MSITEQIEKLETMLANFTPSNAAAETIASTMEELHRLRHIKDLWDEFGDVPMDPCLEIIEADWHGFAAGTFRENIWHWFESYFKISVADLL